MTGKQEKTQKTFHFRTAIDTMMLRMVPLILPRSFVAFLREFRLPPTKSEHVDWGTRKNKPALNTKDVLFFGYK